MRRWGAWLAVLLPAAVGASLAAIIVLRQAPAPPPNVHLIVDSATLALISGLALSGVALGGLGLAAWARRRRAQAVAGVLSAAAADHRRFLQRLDHELKNPLTAIQTGLALMRPDAGGSHLGDGSETARASVAAQVTRISRLTGDLRKLAELEQRALEQGPVDIAELLSAVVDVNTGQAAVGERRLLLTLPQAPWPLPSISGDRDLLLLALHNLVDNAIKFTRPGDRVEVRASENSSSVVVEVADTGPGIPADELPHIWDELYRAKGARGVPGSGLGLALTQAIVQRHGGTAAARSRAGQGTVITVRLPIEGRSPGN